MQLVQFSDSKSIVTSTTRFGTSVRLQNAKEFKAARGLKGAEGKRQFNEYLRTHGKANTAGLAAALTTGELLVKGYRDGKNTLSVSFVKSSSIKDPKKEAEVSMDAALAALGLSKEEYEMLKGAGK